VNAIADHAAELMRKIVVQPDWAAKIGEAIRSTFLPEKVCAQLLAELHSTR
jgi:hypothetical protein